MRIDRRCRWWTTAAGIEHRPGRPDPMRVRWPDGSRSLTAHSGLHFAVVHEAIEAMRAAGLSGARAIGGER